MEILHSILHVQKTLSFSFHIFTIDILKTKVHFKNLLALVHELKAKNELLKKELRNRDDLISSYEKMNWII